MYSDILDKKDASSESRSCTWRALVSFDESGVEDGKGKIPT
jgi:hypothetical protein